MTDRKISQLPIASAAGASDVVPIVQSGVTKQISVGDLLLGGAVNVKWYGATGDGATDDTAACNAALAVGGKIEFTDGTFIVSSSLLAASNSEIVIRPDATIKSKASTAFVSTGLIKCSGVTDVTIHGGGTFDGNRANNSAGRVFGVEIKSSSARIRVEGLRFKDMPSNGDGTNGGDGVYVDSSTDVWIVGNRIEDFDRNAVSVISGSRIHIKDNVVDGSAYLHGIDIEPNTGTDELHDIIISGNIVQDTEKAGIALALSNTALFDNISVIGNTVRDTVNATYGNGIEINTVTAVRGIIVANNNIEDAAVAGIKFTNSGTEGAVISGNYIRSSASYGIAIDNSAKVSVTGNFIDADTETGIIGNGSDEVQITGNTIRVNGNFNGVHLFQTDDSVVSGNVIRQIGSAQGNGVRTSTGSAHSGNVITSNRIRGFANGISDGAGISDSLIIGNNVKNNTTTIANSGTNPIVRSNIGYVTEASGTGSIASGATTATIAHGLSKTPAAANIAIVFTEQGSNDYGRWWISGISSTQFTVNVSADPGASNLDFSWQAEII